jgi:hypothetical protein
MAGKRDKPEDVVLKLRQVEVLQGQGLNRSSRINLTLPAPPHRKSFWRHHLPRSSQFSLTVSVRGMSMRQRRNVRM